jgi:integrase
MVFKRENSKFYWYKFMFNGKYIRESAKTSSKRKAEKAEEERRTQLRRIALGLEKPPKPLKPEVVVPKFEGFAKDWLELYVKVNCKEGTYRLNKQIVEDHLSPTFGKKNLDEITRPMIEAFIAKKLSQKKQRKKKDDKNADQTLSKATVRNYMSILRGILSKAVKDEVLSVNRASNMGRFQKETSSRAAAKKIVPLTPAELQVLLSKAREKDFVLYAFFLTAVLTGLRISEMIGLQWGDWDPVNHVLYIKRAVTHRRIETPKSHNLRTVDVSDELQTALEQLRTFRKEQWLKKGQPVPEWVFCNDEGNYLNELLFRMRKFYPLITAAKLRKFRIHDLRHTYASLMLQNGESVTYVKEQMGHHSIQITVDTYGHLIPGANRAAADRLSATILTPAKAEAQTA